MSRQLEHILQDAGTFKRVSKLLKDRSPYYPEFIKEQVCDTTYFSTKVRKKFGSTWYTVHVLRSYFEVVDMKIDATVRLGHLMMECAFVQHLYKQCGLEDVDVLQIDETERIADLSKRAS